MAGLVGMCSGSAAIWNNVALSKSTATVHNHKSNNPQRTLRQIYDDIIVGWNSLRCLKKDENGEDIEDFEEKRRINRNRTKSRKAPRHGTLSYSVDRIGNVHMYILTDGNKVEYPHDFPESLR